MSNINVDYDGALTISWDAPSINGNTVNSYTVTVFLDSNEVYTETSGTPSLSASRSDIQPEGDAVRTQNTEYRLIITAENGRGQGPEASDVFVIPAGTCVYACVLSDSQNLREILAVFLENVSVLSHTESAAPPDCKSTLYIVCVYMHHAGFE